MGDTEQTFPDRKISLHGSVVNDFDFQKTATFPQEQASKWNLSLKFGNGFWHENQQIDVVVSYIGNEILQPESMEFNFIFKKSCGTLVRSQKEIQTDFGASEKKLTRGFTRCELPRVPFDIQVDIQKVASISSDGQDKMQALLTSKKHSDFVIGVMGTDIPVHRCILGISSSYFEGLLRSEMSEATSGSVEMNNLTLDTARAMVDFMYIGKVNNPTVSLVLNLFRASDMYDIHDLQQWCYLYLKQQLDKNSVLDILVSAHDCDHSDLKKMCLNFLKTNRHQIEFDAKWKQELGERSDLSLEVLEKIWK